MSKFWRIPDEYPESLIGEYEKSNPLDRFALKKGTSVSNSNVLVTITFSVTSDNLEAYDDLANNAMVPLVSARLAQFLKAEAANDIELIDTLIKTKDGSIDSYKLVNVCSRIDGIDKAASTYICVPGTDQIMKFKSVVLKGHSFLGERHLARESSFSSFLHVSASLSEKLEQMKFRGVGLYSVNDLTF